MKGLRNRFERFCFKHHNKGIPNLMLFISIGNAIVYALSMVYGAGPIFNLLCFDKALILQGQVWRLFSCIFAEYATGENIIFAVIGLLCYYSLGRAIENTWGTLRFNLFYLCGFLMMDIFAMLFSDMPVTIDGVSYVMDSMAYAEMGYYLNLSLFIAYATLYPDTHFLLLFFIPVKAWIFALFDIATTLLGVLSMSVPVMLFPHNLYPLVALANYFLFFGKDVANILPMSWRSNFRRLFKKKDPQKKTGTVPFPTAGSYAATTATVKAPYTHRCAVCGRTDVSNPDLEFRYCSRCKGYHCYCEDHISNHTHIEE